LPWNFHSTLIRKEVGSLDTPVNNEKYFPAQLYVGLFKDYAEALHSNDFETLTQLLEPSFRRQMTPNLEHFHQVLE
jgi:hypothetical protein